MILQRSECSEKKDYWIPITQSLQPDELLYSYVQRLAMANGLPYGMFEKAFALEPMAIPAEKQGRPRRDSSNDYSRFYHGTGQTCSLLQFYSATTVLPGYVPLLSRPVFSSYVARWNFRNELANLIPESKALFSHVRICPECKQEELRTKGVWYIHRSHQMVDAAICYKHGCQLLKYGADHCFAELSDDSLFKYVNNTSSDPRYEVFLHDLLQSDIQASLEDILLLLQVADEKEARQYKSIPINKINPQKVSHSLFRVFTTANILKEAILCEFRTKESVLASISGSCQLTQPYRDDFIELQCQICGRIFVTTPFRILQGFRCPDCDSKLTMPELLHRLTACSYSGEYSLLGEYKGNNQTITVVHTCGRTLSSTVQRFVSGEIKCPQCSQLTEEKMRATIHETQNGEFELVKGNNPNQLLLLHTACDRTFFRRYDIFVRYPCCPKCNLQKQLAPRRPEYLWDAMARRSKRKANGGKKYAKNN